MPPSTLSIVSSPANHPYTHRAEHSRERASRRGRGPMHTPTHGGHTGGGPIRAAGLHGRRGGDSTQQRSGPMASRHPRAAPWAQRAGPAPCSQRTRPQVRPRRGEGGGGGRSRRQKAAGRARETGPLCVVVRGRCAASCARAGQACARQPGSRRHEARRRAVHRVWERDTGGEPCWGLTPRSGVPVQNGTPPVPLGPLLCSTLSWRLWRERHVRAPPGEVLPA